MSCRLYFTDPWSLGLAVEPIVNGTYIGSERWMWSGGEQGQSGVHEMTWNLCLSLIALKDSPSVMWESSAGEGGGGGLSSCCYTCMGPRNWTDWKRTQRGLICLLPHGNKSAKKWHQAWWPSGCKMNMDSVKLTCPDSRKMSLMTHTAVEQYREGNSETWHSCFSKWFSQVHMDEKVSEERLLGLDLMHEWGSSRWRAPLESSHNKLCECSVCKRLQCGVQKEKGTTYSFASRTLEVFIFLIFH